MKTILKDFVRAYSNFPKKGVVFWDIAPLIKSPDALKASVRLIKQHFCHKSITKIAAIESKGFILGGILATAPKTSGLIWFVASALTIFGVILAGMGISDYLRK